jgi:hypothetical protein
MTTNPVNAANVLVSIALFYFVAEINLPQDGADKPADGAQEGEGNDGLPLRARGSSVEVDAVPVKDVAGSI